ncbi:hypothetical protein EA007_00060 [Vibrio anguillarum]|uniref:secretion/conjugation apparatus DotM-related subunit n=4 Tax=Vibrio anguillarum TaxID=55601 RepID=UPI00188A2257|nr:hypothetical protein [Vibrio anguillarum]MBF4249424.1 hypothetical protein [Vibrio anguillarum]
MSDNAAYNDNWGIIISCFFILLGFTLWFFDEILTYPWAIWRYIDSTIWSNMFFLPDFITKPHEAIITGLDNLPSWRLLDYGHVYKVEYMVIYKTTWIYLIPTIFAILRITRKTRHIDKYKKRLDYDELLAQETHVWRYNRYLVNNNPSKETLDVDEGRYACRENTRSGLKRTQCISIDRESNRVELNYERAIDVFSKQLRYPINGIDDIYKLPPVFQFLIAAFCLRELSLQNIYSAKDIAIAKRKVRTAHWMKIVLPKNFHPKWNDIIMHYAYFDYKLTNKIKHDLDFNEDLRFQLLGDYSFHLNGEHDYQWVQMHVDKILPIAFENKRIKSFISQHAYGETLLRRLLREGRKAGKFSPSQFSFIKIVDRQLWYALNDEGLPGCSFEAAGVKAHFELEFKTKRCHIFPTVTHAFSYLEAMNIPKTGDEYDKIIVPMQHPYASLYPYNPDIELQEHLGKLENDYKYKLQQTLVRQVI